MGVMVVIDCYGLGIKVLEKVKNIVFINFNYFWFLNDFMGIMLIDVFRFGLKSENR